MIRNPKRNPEGKEDLEISAFSSLWLLLDLTSSPWSSSGHQIDALHV